MRGTFTHFNKDFASDVCHLADLGFQQISVEPVVAPESAEYALAESELPELLAEYDKLAAEMIRRHREGRGFNFFHFMIDLQGTVCLQKAVRLWFWHRVSGSDAVGRLLSLSSVCRAGGVPDGQWRRVLQEQIFENNSRHAMYIQRRSVRTALQKFYCSGGCAANSYNFHGNIHDVYELGCELQRKRVECAIMIKAALAEEDAK